MKPSSLQLESSAITRVKIEVNKAFPKDRTNERFAAFEDANLGSSVEFGPDANNPRRYYLKLEISLPGTEQGPTPYILDLEIIGIFLCVNDNCEEDERLVEFNGPAVLYGSIRELVMQITSRGPFSPLVLPTVNFIPPDTKIGPDGIEEKQQ